MSRILSLILALMLVFVLAACNLPSSQPTEAPDIVFTSAALTVQAELTRVSQTQAPSATSTSNIPVVVTATGGSLPSVATRTPTTVPCNLIDFIDDVTYKDTPTSWTHLAPGTSFTKTWRLKNAGTCPWTTAYQLYFHSESQMGGPLTQPLTSTVLPGQMVDISVNLTSPTTAGIYTGKWGLRDNSGNSVPLDTGLSYFWVKIEVDTAGTGLTLNVVDSESGSARSDSTTQTAKDVGDLTTNIGSQAFVAFDINAIPDTATITEVKVDFSNYVTSGAPFTDLGCLRVFHDDYQPLDPTDFFTGVPGTILVQYCNSTALSTVAADADMKTALQGEVTGGDTRLRLRLQFTDMITNSEGGEDLVKFGAIKLIVTYTTP